MYKVSPSMLESFRVFKNEIYDTTVEQMIATIKGEFKTTPQMQFGTEVHKFFEDMSTSNLMLEELEQLAEIALLIPQGVNEVYQSIELHGVRFNMIFDRMIGKELREFKVGSRFSGVDYFENSVQWKLYLLGSGCDKITYDVITHTEARPVKFKYIQPFSFYPYTGMEDDVMDLVHEFIEFCVHHKVDNYIQYKNKPIQLMN